MRKLKNYIGFLFAAIFVLGACSDKDIVDNPSGETIIYDIKIVNGDISGAGRFAGTIDEDSKTIAFTIPTESDIKNIIFEAKLSLGAKFNATSYDFSTALSQPIRVENVANVGTYTVNMTLAAPTGASPFLEKVVVTLADGTDVDAYVSPVDNTVYLRSPNENEVTVKRVVARPVRTEVTFTNATAGKILKSNPGKVQLNFLGTKSEYNISFDEIPAYGADFTKGIIFDFSAKTTIFPDFSSINTRNADFDGEHVLIVSRTGGLNPKLLKREDIMTSKTPSPIMLDMTNVTGGVYPISSGRLAQGHIYITNLTTGLNGTVDGKLKLYHWATPTSAPELIMDFDGNVGGGNPVVTGRYGDNISVNLDASGNGYIYWGDQAGLTSYLRAKVTNFTTVSEFKAIKSPVGLGMYGTYHAVDDPEGEYLLTAVNAPLVLVDKDGNELSKVANMPSPSTFPANGLDTRIVTFDSERYLIMTSGFSTSLPAHTFYVYDITDGYNTVTALSNFEKSDKKPIFTYSLGGGNATAPNANTGWGVANGKLYTFASGTLGGFTVFEFSEKQ